MAEWDYGVGLDPEFICDKRVPFPNKQKIVKTNIRRYQT
jgi:hypothetical protein